MASEIVLQQPDEGELKGKGSELVAQALALKIENQDHYEHAGIWLVEVKGIAKKLLDRFTEPCSKARVAWQAMTKMRDEALAPFTEAEDLIKQEMGRYQWQIEEQRRKEAEKARIAAEKKAREERERQIAEAKKLKDKEAVKNLQSAPLEVEAVAPKTPEVAQAKGVSMRRVWKVQSIDEVKLPRQYLTANMQAINATVRGLGAKHGIPGVVVVEEMVTAVRS